MKFSIRNNLIALFIFYAIFFTFLNAFYGNSVSFIPPYLHNALNYLSTIASTLSSVNTASSGNIVSAIIGLGTYIWTIILMILDFIFIFLSIISLVGYYPYLIITYVPSPINIFIFTITIVILMVDIITGIQILQSGFSGGNE